jgi:plastocyanin
MKGFIASLLLLAASMAQATDHVVTLGAGGALKFSPDQLTAAQGDTVTFEFLAGVCSSLTSSC